LLMGKIMKNKNGPKKYTLSEPFIPAAAALWRAKFIIHHL